MLLTFATYSFSQDIIIRTNGDTVDCNITRIDSVNVYFSLYKNGREIFTSLNKSQIQEIRHGSFSESNTPDSITMKKVFGGYKFYLGDRILNMSNLINTMRPNEQAYYEIKAAQSTYTIASIFSFAGGFLVGWPLGTAIAGGDPNWTLAGIGAGLIIISIPITQKFIKQTKGAVKTYNQGLQAGSLWNNTELKLSMTSYGAGIILKF